LGDIEIKIVYQEPATQRGGEPRRSLTGLMRHHES